MGKMLKSMGAAAGGSGQAFKAAGTADKLNMLGAALGGDTDALMRMIQSQQAGGGQGGHMMPTGLSAPTQQMPTGGMAPGVSDMISRLGGESGIGPANPAAIPHPIETPTEQPHPSFGHIMSGLADRLKAAQSSYDPSKFAGQTAPASPFANMAVAPPEEELKPLEIMKLPQVSPDLAPAQPPLGFGRKGFGFGRRGGAAQAY